MPLLDRLEEEFSDKRIEIVEKNKECASAGYDYVHEEFRGHMTHKVPPAPLTKKKMLLSGSQAMALGAIFSGLKFYSGYPMSPSTPIMEFIASIAQEYNIIVTIRSMDLQKHRLLPRVSWVLYQKPPQWELSIRP
jgi:2-oxoglutarate/2-oxoacid ferredoxin oxidoreductase subunit alpha